MWLGRGRKVGDSHRWETGTWAHCPSFPHHMGSGTWKPVLWEQTLLAAMSVPRAGWTLSAQPPTASPRTIGVLGMPRQS